jgi:hypothetical protein
MTIEAPVITEAAIGRLSLVYRREGTRALTPIEFGVQLGQIQALYVASLLTVLADVHGEVHRLVTSVSGLATMSVSHMHMAEKLGVVEGQQAGRFVSFGARSVLNALGTPAKTGGLGVPRDPKQTADPLAITYLSYASPYTIVLEAVLGGTTMVTAFAILVRAVRTLGDQVRGLELDREQHSTALSRLHADAAEEIARENRALVDFEKRRHPHVDDGLVLTDGTAEIEEAF